MNNETLRLRAQHWFFTCRPKGMARQDHKVLVNQHDAPIRAFGFLKLDELQARLLTALHNVAVTEAYRKGRADAVAEMKNAVAIKPPKPERRSACVASSTTSP